MEEKAEDGWHRNVVEMKNLKIQVYRAPSIFIHYIYVIIFIGVTFTLGWASQVDLNWS